MASLLTSGSIRIVVAGMLDGMAEPLLVYLVASILPPLRDRALGGAGIGRHEGPAPPEAGEVGIEVLRRHALERPHEGAEERMDGVDPVDGPPPERSLESWAACAATSSSARTPT